jgi:molybdopterin-containing oxidoreductase family membrane subunit
MSFSFGLAFYLLILMASYNWTNRKLGDMIINRLRNLLGIFVAAVLYFVIVFHIGNIYLAENNNVEMVLFSPQEIYTNLFWYGQIILGSIVPLFLLYHPATKHSRSMLGLASVLIILGGLAQMYVLIVGGQAYPLEMFPGKDIVGSYGLVMSYVPSLPEIALGVGGVALALVMITFLLKFLPFLPESLADDVIAPNSKK